MSAKLNKVIFYNEPEDIWNEIQKSCIETGRKWLIDCDLITSYQGNANSIAAMIPYNDHPFIKYLEENNIGKGPRLHNKKKVHLILYTEIIPEDNELHDMTYIGLRYEVVNTFECKVLQYGIGEEHVR